MRIAVQSYSSLRVLRRSSLTAGGAGDGGDGGAGGGGDGGAGDGGAGGAGDGGAGAGGGDGVTYASM